MGGITFRPDLAAAVLAGTKTVTRRRCSDNPRSPWYTGACGLKPGRSYAIQPGRGKPAIGRALVVSVHRERLGYLGDMGAQREGFPTRDEFEAAWVAINGSYNPAAEVWRVELQLVVTT